MASNTGFSVFLIECEPKPARQKLQARKRNKNNSLYYFTIFDLSKAIKSDVILLCEPIARIESTNSHKHQSHLYNITRYIN